MKKYLGPHDDAWLQRLNTGYELKDSTGNFSFTALEVILLSSQRDYGDLPGALVNPIQDLEEAFFRSTQCRTTNAYLVKQSSLTRSYE